jgi:hypothetical protein
VKWILLILACALGITTLIWMIGSHVIDLPRTYDPFPSPVRTQLETLNENRREIEWLVSSATMAGKGSELPEERQAYNELANDANAWLKTVGLGVELNRIDTIWLKEQFEERLMPKAKKLAATLKLKMRWLKLLRREQGFVRVAAADINNIAAALGNGWDDVTAYFKLLRARDAESRKIAMNQLDDMKWVPWSQIMAEQF